MFSHVKTEGLRFQVNITGGQPGVPVLSVSKPLEPHFFFYVVVSNILFYNSVMINGLIDWLIDWLVGGVWPWGVCWKVGLQGQVGVYANKYLLLNRAINKIKLTDRGIDKYFTEIFVLKIQVYQIMEYFLMRPIYLLCFFCVKQNLTD